MYLSNILKQSLQGNAFKCANLMRCSSTPPGAAMNQQQEELDKLYQAVELEMRGNDPAVLNSFSHFATVAGNHLDIESKSWNLRKPVNERFTVLKAAHIYKKHRVQYEIRTYYTFVQYKHLTGSTADTLLEYIQRNLPEGVALKTTKVELQKIPDHFVPPKK